jgi:hypothetical protein
MVVFLVLADVVTKELHCFGSSLINEPKRRSQERVLETGRVAAGEECFRISGIKFRHNVNTLALPNSPAVRPWYR